MSSDILWCLNQPKELEKLYRKDKSKFKKEFNELYPEIKDRPIATYWYERLNYEGSEISWGSGWELVFVILLSLAAGSIAKIPHYFAISEQLFYPRNVGFILFPALSLYFIRKNKLSIKKILFQMVFCLICLIHINMLPQNDQSQTLMLACIHLPIILCGLVGMSFVGEDFSSPQKRVDFLRYGGDLLVMTSLLGIAGMIMSGLTINLFALIGFQIEKFYTKNIVIYGLAAAPLIATYLTQNNPQLINKVSPVIAKIFSPLILITLIVYLIAINLSGKDPYSDREFLLLFNALLIAVMALILFSIAESNRGKRSQWTLIVLVLLSLITIIINGITLSAILFRINAWGFTPNRSAVLGSNILILCNLVVICYRLIRASRNTDKLEAVERSMSLFLPFYFLWAIVVTFVFPLVFGFK